MALKIPALETFFVDGPAGLLESTLELPAGEPVAAAVICHPHPQFEGTLRNKVVHTLARAHVDVGVAAIRFNFRGVGDSAGSYAAGEGETEDALALLDWAAGRFRGVPLWLAGFSFGAWIAIRASGLRPVTRLTTVAPAVRLFNPDLEPPTCPWTIVQGDDDELVDIADVIDWVRQSGVAPDLAVMAGAGHFFHGRIRELRDLLVARLRADPGTAGPG